MNSQNKQDVATYLLHLEGLQRAPGTINAARVELSHLLAWVDDTALGQTPALEWTFPAFLAVRHPGHKRINRESSVRICRGCRAFFTWASSAYPERYPLTSEWITSFRLPVWRRKRAPHEPYTTNRTNQADVRAFLAYREKTLQNDPKTVRRAGVEMRHLLTWAGRHALSAARSFEQTFPAFLLSRGKPISPAHLEKTCAGARAFFRWARRDIPTRYQRIPESWIDTIRPRRSSGSQSVLHQVKSWKLQDLLKLARLKPATLAEQRDRAAACFLYLSGMRITAFVTLPIACIHLATRAVEQLPEKGVETKNHKAAITYLLEIPELLAVVSEWDNLIREMSPDPLPWFAALSPGGEYIITDPEQAGAIHTEGRRQAFARGLRDLCQRAGVPYHSAHKLRHGHALYGVSHSRTMKEYKAVSQNLMHASISVTDGIYGNLTGEDLGATIAGLGGSSTAINVDVLARALLQIDPELIQKVMEAR